MHKQTYNNSLGAVDWSGIQFVADTKFEEFLEKEVAERLFDTEAKEKFKNVLSGLATSGFEIKTLQTILEADQPETRAWAISEALAEAWLSREHNAVWPWNMDRDKRTPKASLPGADLVGFVDCPDGTKLLFGEVKSSSDMQTPPNVLYGRTGLVSQLESLSGDPGLLSRLLQWLLPRCNSSDMEVRFKASVKSLLGSGFQAMTLYGVLVRDTSPNEADLQNRGKSLGNKVGAPTDCHLLALYLPCPISSLPDRFKTGEAV